MSPHLLAIRAAFFARPQRTITLYEATPVAAAGERARTVKG